MDILIIASLIIGAVILFLVELFVIPGISVAGFLAGGCIIFANYYAFAYMGYAEINGDIVEVKSSDGFLNEKTPIIVDRIADGVLLVERLKQ